MGLEKALEYCDEPWLLDNVERVYFFGGEGVLGCSVPLLGLVVVNGVCMDGNFTYNNNNKANTPSCICCYYSWTILVSFKTYAV